MRVLVRELEKQGYSKLSLEQRGKLERIRLSMLGLSSWLIPRSAKPLDSAKGS